MQGFKTKPISPAQKKLLGYFARFDNRSEFYRLSHLGSNGKGGHASRTAESLVALGLLESKQVDAGRMREGRGPWRRVYVTAYRITTEGEEAL